MATVHDIQQLVAAMKAQQESIQQLADSVALLAQCVAMLLGEELGAPVPDPQAQDQGELDMDGVPIS